MKKKKKELRPLNVHTLTLKNFHFLWIKYEYGIILCMNDFIVIVINKVIK